MSRVREKSTRWDLGISLAIIGVLLLGGTYGPVGDRVPAETPESTVAGGALQSYWHATMLEIRASWRGVFGQAQNSGYQLYASSMGGVTDADRAAHQSPVNGDLGPLSPVR
jgi:hypothetical protein